MKSIYKNLSKISINTNSNNFLTYMRVFNTHILFLICANLTFIIIITTKTRNLTMAGVVLIDPYKQSYPGFILINKEPLRSQALKKFKRFWTELMLKKSPY